MGRSICITRCYKEYNRFELAEYQLVKIPNQNDVLHQLIIIMSRYFVMQFEKIKFMCCRQNETTIGLLHEKKINGSFYSTLIRVWRVTIKNRTKTCLSLPIVTKTSLKVSRKMYSKLIEKSMLY